MSTLFSISINVRISAKDSNYGPGMISISQEIDIPKPITLEQAAKLLQSIVDVTKVGV